MAISPDGRYLLCVFFRGKMVVLEKARAGASEPRLLAGSIMPMRACAISGDGRLITCSSDEQTLLIFNAASGQVERSLPLGATSLFMAFHPRKDLLAHGDRRGLVLLRDLASRSEPVALSGHTDDVLAAQFSASGELLLTGSKDKTARLWDVASGASLAVLGEHEGRVASVAFSPDGRSLATGSWDGKLRLWSPETHALVSTIDANQEGINSLLFVRNDLVVVGGLDGKVQALEVPSGRESWAQKVHAEAVSGLACFPDGSTGLSVSHDGAAQLWDLRTGRTRKRVWVGGGGVNALAVNGASQTLVCGCKDGDGRVWDLKALKESPRIDGAGPFSTTPAK